MRGTYEDVVVSSRVRLARNSAELPFPHKLSGSNADLLTSKIYTVMQNIKPKDSGVQDDFVLYRMKAISKADGLVLKEKHLISSDLLENVEYGAAIINESETISVMVGEEDHIREQCILPGLTLRQAYKRIDEIDDEIASAIKLAFDPDLGYLTSCLTNLGTGMRVSAMMFLPGLSITGALETTLNKFARLNMAVRGVYGEGSKADGFLYQISNQKTLGISEEDILSSVQGCIMNIAEEELEAREKILAGNETELRDKIMRAYGTLCYAYRLTTKEFMEMLAFVKLGVFYGFIKIEDVKQLEKLVTYGQPANVASYAPDAKTREKRDIARAEYVSKVLKGLK